MGIGPIGEDRTEKNKKDSRRWVPYTDLKGRARFQEVILLSGIGVIPGSLWESSALWPLGERRGEPSERQELGRGEDGSGV